MTLPTGWYTKWPAGAAASNTSPITTTQEWKKLGELFTAHAFHTLLDESMAETRSTKWRSTKPIPACFSATINKNASLKNEKLGTNAKPDVTLEQQAQTGTAPGKLEHMVTLRYAL